MSIVDWISIAIACFVGAASPGPSILIIVYHSSTKGAFKGIICSIGHGIGIFIYALITALGVKYFFESFPQILFLIKIFGILFLFFISVQMFLYKETHDEKLSKINLQNYNSLTLGIVTALINPKVILFFGAIFSQFLKPELDLENKLLISCLASLIDAIWYILVVFLSTLTISTYLIKYKQITVKCLGIILFTATIIMIMKIFNLNINF